MIQILDKKCGGVIMKYMNNRTIVSTLLVIALFAVSAPAVIAYNEASAAGAPVCNSEKPQKAWLYRVKSLGGGKYQLFWDKADRATSWTIGYGTEPGKYIYGLNNFGDSKSRNLTVNTYSGKKFYFVIKANNGCMPGEWSNEWKVGNVTALAPLVRNEVFESIETPVVTKTQGKYVAPTIRQTQSPTTIKKVGQTPLATPTVAPKGGFWEWLKGLFR